MTFIKSIKTSGSKINLYKLDEKLLSEDIKGTTLFSEGINLCFLDLETTGFNAEQDKIIEIALKVVRIDKSDGSIISVEDKYESFQDPGIHIDDKITKITGISNEMVSGHEINWNKVSEIIQKTDVMVAHNAKFDRSFMDISTPISKDKIWACSIYDIDWLERGFVKGSLELLSIWHGFYYDSHRAMNDVNATVHLLLHPSYKTYPPLEELVENSEKPQHIIINKFPYNDSFIKALKKRGGYRYNPTDKSWRIIFKDKDLLDVEVEWLKENIYNGYFQGQVQEISVFDKYKTV